MTGNRSPRPLVSIVMPTCNSDAYLAEALQSIRSQPFKNWELVVVDDGSERPPVEIVRSMIGSATILTQENQGPSAARNTAIVHSRGELIAFLDSDDYWSPDALPTLLRGLENAPSAGMIQAHVKQVSAADDKVRMGPSYLSFNVGSLLVPRQTFDRVGPFDERLRQSEDVDFHIRFKEAGLRKLAIPETVLYYRQHANSTTVRHRPEILKPAHHGNWLRLLGESLRRRRAPGASGIPQQQSATAETPSPRREHVTAIICARNAREFLPAALDSIRGQTLPVNRILAVVGQSGDGTEEFLEGEPDVTVLHQTGDGLANARNTALGHVDHGYLAFLDADDRWDPRKVELQLEALSLLKSPGYSITNFRRTPLNPVGAAAREVPRHEGIGYRLGVTPSTLVAHASIFEKVGPFDAALGNACDTDWFSRALEAVLPCAVLGQCLTIKTVHDRSLSFDNLGNRADMFRLLAKRRQGERPAGMS